MRLTTATWSLLLFVALAARAAPALADPAPPPAPTAPASPAHLVSITFSPVHLALPIFEVTGEIRDGDSFGFALILGGGEVQGLGAFEVGAQARFYALGDFEGGLQIGAEVLYLHLDGGLGSTNSTSLSGSGTGAAIGAFVGYKTILAIGLTFEAQGGAEVVNADASASATSATGSSTATASDVRVIPLLNLNVGWSF